jgi:ketosteroid isomerase-like protein
MDYEKFDVEELISDGDHVVAIITAAGRAIRAGRPFVSHIVRVYAFRGGKIVRVRNFYDTAAYERALALD